MSIIKQRVQHQQCKLFLDNSGYTNFFSDRRVGAKQYEVVANAEVLHRLKDSADFKAKINRLTREGYKIVFNLEGFLHAPTESWNISNIIEELIQSVGQKNIAWIELGGLVTPELLNITYKNNKIQNDSLFRRRFSDVFHGSGTNHKEYINTVTQHYDYEKERISKVCSKYHVPFFLDCDKRAEHGINNSMVYAGHISDVNISQDNRSISYSTSTTPQRDRYHKR